MPVFLPLCTAKDSLYSVCHDRILLFWPSTTFFWSECTLPTTTGTSVRHSPSLDKGKLFCLFVCHGTLSYYGLSVFSLPIPHGMHLMVSTQFCFFWVVCHLNRILLPKELEQEPQNRFFPSPHHQTMPSYLWPMISSCPILAGYRLVKSGPYACLSSTYVQNLPTAPCICRGWLA